MKSRFWLALMSLLLLTPWSSSSPAPPREPSLRELAPYGAQYDIVTCTGGERTLVIASGIGTAPLGLYVYDAHGNCIARDEAIFAQATQAIDDVAVEWFPTARGVFTVELRNQGAHANKAQVVFR